MVTVRTTAPQTVNSGVAGPLGGFNGGAAQVEFIGGKSLKLVGQPELLPSDKQMKNIKNFKEIRRDRKVIYESMKVEDIFALGPAEKIVEIQWHNGPHLVSLASHYGILARVVAGRDFVAANEYDESGRKRILSILNADGSRRFQLSNIQSVRGKNEAGDFRWFEPPGTDVPDIFGVVFNRTSDDSMFQLDIDASSGVVVGVYPMR